MKLSVKQKINHSNMWVKLVDSETKSEAKFFISFSSVRITMKPTSSTREFFHGVAKRINEIYNLNRDEAPIDILGKIEELLKEYA